MGLLANSACVVIIAATFGCANASSAIKEKRCAANDEAVIEAALKNEVDLLQPGKNLVMYDTTVVPRVEQSGDILKYFPGEAANSLMALV